MTTYRVRFKLIWVNPIFTSYCLCDLQQITKICWAYISFFLSLLKIKLLFICYRVARECYINVYKVLILLGISSIHFVFIVLLLLFSGYLLVFTKHYKTWWLKVMIYFLISHGSVCRLSLAGQFLLGVLHVSAVSGIWTGIIWGLDLLDTSDNFS